MPASFASMQFESDSRPLGNPTRFSRVEKCSIWDYQTSDLFSEAERAALDVATAAGSVPNGVSDDQFLQLRKYWSEEQIVEIVAVISVFGFLNRWNDTMATPLEDEPVQVGEKFLASHGWTPGKHSR